MSKAEKARHGEGIAMGQSAKAWTAAMEDFLKDGEWKDTDEVLAIGAALVTDERALQEMGSKQTGHDEARRIAIGKRNVAQQSLSGMVRFVKAEYDNPKTKKQVRRVVEAISPAEQVARIKTLEEQVETLIGQVDSLQAQVDRLDGESE